MNSLLERPISRRRFTALLGSAALAAAAAEHAAGADAAGRDLDFVITTGFGDASKADVEAVLRSSAGAIWRHCPTTRWAEPGFYIYHSTDSPITLDQHRPDGRIAIGLTPQGNLWSQFAFQFAHEFCHALAGHSNDWRRNWIDARKPNQWLEESICETASLFSLRAMSESWQTAPPYPNWKAYAAHLKEYAGVRIAAAAAVLGDKDSLTDWLKANEPAMRTNPTMREKNNVVALRLLPLFEAEPSGWESVTFYNRGSHDPRKSLADQFAEWTGNVPPEQRKFVGRIAALLGL